MEDHIYPVVDEDIKNSYDLIKKMGTLSLIIYLIQILLIMRAKVLF